MLGKMLRKRFSSYWIGMLLLVLGVFIQTLSPKVLGEAIDALRASPIDSAVVRNAALNIVWIALLSFVLRFAWRMQIIGGSRHLERSLRTALLEKLQRLPVSFYHAQRSGDLMAYAVNDIGAVRMALGPGLAHVLTGVSMAIFTLSSMGSTISPTLTLLSLLPALLALLMIGLLGAAARKRFRRVQEQFASLSGFVNESITGMRVIKSFAKEHAQQAAYEEESQRMMALGIDQSRVSSAIAPVSQALFGLCFAIAILYGGTLVRQGDISLGAFASFIAYLLMIMQPIVALSRVVAILQRGMASYKRLRDLFDAPEIPAFDIAPDEPLHSTSLCAKGLTFRYPGASHDALSDIDFTLAHGQTLGIVGDTGSGKSTLLSLLMKQYDVAPSMLFVDGRDIATVSAHDIHAQTGYVPQEGFLFSGTIAENIAFAEADAVDMDAARNAAAQAGLLHDVQALPNGFETEVGERGGQLSGGQRQRTALARALYQKPMLLLLDDTLSAVDAATQRHMIDALHNIAGQCTTIIVSHKLSAVAHADEILFLSGGRIVERGTHASLMTAEGKYCRIYRSQQREEDAI